VTTTTTPCNDPSPNMHACCDVTGNDDHNVPGQPVLLQGQTTATAMAIRAASGTDDNNDQSNHRVGQQ